MKFLLLTDPRSGTMMLTDSLAAAHPDIRWYNLYAANPDNPLGHHRNWEKHLQGSGHAGTTMHRVGDTWLRSMSPVIPGDFWRLLREKHNRWILLHRSNILRQYLSRQVGIILRTYSVAEPRKVDPGPVRIVMQEFLDYLEQILTLRREIDKWFPSSERLQLVYEQVIENWPLSFQQIQQYLGLSVVDIKPITYQQETRLLRDVIQNYNEVRSYLVNRNYERWFDE